MRHPQNIPKLHPELKQQFHEQLVKQRAEAIAWIDSVMAQAQVFASAWALVGSRFDKGDELANAEAQKQELRDMLSARVGVLD